MALNLTDMKSNALTAVEELYKTTFADPLYTDDTPGAPKPDADRLALDMATVIVEVFDEIFRALTNDAEVSVSTTATTSTPDAQAGDDTLAGTATGTGTGGIS